MIEAYLEVKDRLEFQIYTERSKTYVRSNPRDKRKTQSRLRVQSDETEALNVRTDNLVPDFGPPKQVQIPFAFVNCLISQLGRLKPSCSNDIKTIKGLQKQLTVYRDKSLGESRHHSAQD